MHLIQVRQLNFFFVNFRKKRPVFLTLSYSIRVISEIRQNGQNNQFCVKITVRKINEKGRITDYKIGNTIEYYIALFFVISLTYLIVLFEPSDKTLLINGTVSCAWRCIFYFILLYLLLFSRVLNVLRHWVDQHFYDFTREDVLGRQLMNFFKRIQKNSTAKKWVENIEKLVSKRVRISFYITFSYRAIFYIYFFFEKRLLRCRFNERKLRNRAEKSRFLLIKAFIFFGK